MNTTASVAKRRFPAKTAAVLQLEEDIHKSSFLAKLFAILSNKHVSSIVSWCEDGERFQICNGDRFQNEVIPLYFKHRNLKSFIRQLNLHGFKKLRSKTKPSDQIQEVYRHHFFRRDQPELVSFIKRKISKPVEGDEKNEQIVSLIERQKELQTKLSELMNTQTANPQATLKSVQEAHNQDLSILISAVDLFKQNQTAEHLDAEQTRIFNLTKDFIKRLTCQDREKQSVSGDELTAPSENVESEPEQEEERYFLATVDETQKKEGWESPESVFETFQSPPKASHLGELSSFYFDAQVEKEHKFDFQICTANDPEWMMLETPL